MARGAGHHDHAQKEAPEGAGPHRARNFAIQVASLAASKTADGLIDPKIVLAWLMTQVGAPALVGLLVPVREAGSLLPQLIVAGGLARIRRRKWAWAAGSALQGLAALGISAAGLLLWGATAGWTILALLLLLAVARSVSSVSGKDVLGRTVARRRRGTATGLAVGIASAAVIAFALVLIFELGPRGALVIWALMAAGGLWLLAGAIYATLKEPPATGTDASPLAATRGSLGLLRTRRELRRFILARALLVPAALAPPYIIALVSATPGRGLAALGGLLLASALAGLLAGPLFGRLADRSSRRLLAGAGAAAALALALTALADALGWLARPWLLPLLLFAVAAAHHATRLGRTVQLVDMAPPEDRPAYTAAANTAIGIVLLAGAVFAPLSATLGPRPVLLLLAAILLVAVPASLRLQEVQARSEGA